MRRKYHRVGFTTAQKTELWDRWQKGEGLKSIGRAFGKGSSRLAAGKFVELKLRISSLETKGEPEPNPNAENGREMAAFELENGHEMGTKALGELRTHVPGTDP